MNRSSAALVFALVVAACANLNGAGAATSAATPAAQSYGNYLAARLAASEHNMADAARLYRESLKYDPDNQDLLAHAFLYTAAAGEIDEAQKLAEQVVKLSPDDRTARLALAVSAMKHADYAAARKHIAQAAKGPFFSLTMALMDAWAAAGQKDYDTALKDIDQVPSLGGSDTLAALHRALILDLAGRNTEADTAYKTAAGGDAPGPRAIEAYGGFLERTGRAADARALYQKSQTDAALEPIATMGLARLDANRMPDRLVPTANDGAGEALFGVAAALTDKSSADIAILYLRLALVLSPDLDLAKIVLADRFEALEKYDDAIDAYRDVSRDSPYRTASEVQVAVDEGKLDRKDKAISDLKAIARAHRNDITVWTALGDAYRAMERWDDAADAYGNAIQTLPAPTQKDWPLFYARGVALERGHHWDKAEQDLLEALKLSPDQPQVLNYLGYSWVDQGKNLAQAVGMLERARALSPFDGYIIDSVGWAYYKLGKYQQAAQTLEDAILLVPGDPTINDHLGDAYWKVGRKLDAHYQWSHALAFGPSDDEKSELEKKLADSTSVAEGPTR